MFYFKALLPGTDLSEPAARLVLSMSICQAFASHCFALLATCARATDLPSARTSFLGINISKTHADLLNI